MQRRKGTFLTFIFSLLPGAGEMYMGFMKKGTSIMFIFFFGIFLSGFFNIGPLLFILPIIWFYSFFNVHNINGLSDEEFYALEDNYIINLDAIFQDHKFMEQKYRKVAAWILLIMGVSILWNNFSNFIFHLVPEIYKNTFWRIHDALPQTLIAIILIAIGVKLIQGKKKQIEQEVYKNETIIDVEEKKDGEIN